MKDLYTLLQSLEEEFWQFVENDPNSNGAHVDFLRRLNKLFQQRERRIVSLFLEQFAPETFKAKSPGEYADKAIKAYHDLKSSLTALLASR